MSATYQEIETIAVEIASAVNIGGEVYSAGQISSAIEIPTIVTPEVYSGPYEVTPTASTQVLNVSGMMMADHVTINPIPSNYGLITWNGASLTVS